MQETNDETNHERRARGLEMYRKVYGDDAFVFEAGQVEFFDQMLTNLFGDVWSRPALAVDQRRLVVMGVLAAQYRYDTLGIQFQRALATGELNVEQVREVVMQLISYVGYPSSSDLYRVSEAAISAHLKTDA